MSLFPNQSLLGFCGKNKVELKSSKEKPSSKCESIFLKVSEHEMPSCSWLSRLVHLLSSFYHLVPKSLFSLPLLVSSTEEGKKNVTKQNTNMQSLLPIPFSLFSSLKSSYSQDTQRWHLDIFFRLLKIAFPGGL